MSRGMCCACERPHYACLCIDVPPSTGLPGIDVPGPGAERGRCSACGCTDLEPCLGVDGDPCAWVTRARTLCTSCLPPEEQIQLVFARIELCRRGEPDFLQPVEKPGPPPPLLTSWVAPSKAAP